LGKSGRFEVIHELKVEYSICALVKVAKVSRAGHYKWLHTNRNRSMKQSQDTMLKEHILGIHLQYPFYRYKRVRVALRREELLVNTKKVRRLMRELGIQSLIRKKRPYYGRKSSVVFPNVINRNFLTSRRLEKLATDITYIRINNDFAYLSVIIDLFNNEVIAWSMSKRNDLALVHATIDQLSEVVGISRAILHSDQGFQYTSKGYANHLAKIGLHGSHSRRGNCFDNACIESFFSHLKAEEIYLNKPESFETAKRNIKAYINYYNKARFQTKLKERSPIEYREALAA
jgi:putative transposase